MSTVGPLELMNITEVEAMAQEEVEVFQNSTEKKIVLEKTPAEEFWKDNSKSMQSHISL